MSEQERGAQFAKELFDGLYPTGASRVTEIALSLAHWIPRFVRTFAEMICFDRMDDSSFAGKFWSTAAICMESIADWQFHPDKPPAAPQGATVNERFDVSRAAVREWLEWQVSMFDKCDEDPRADVSMKEDRWAYRAIHHRFFHDLVTSVSAGPVSYLGKEYSSAHEAVLNRGRDFVLEVVMGILLKQSPEDREDNARRLFSRFPAGLGRSEEMERDASRLRALIDHESVKLKAHLRSLAAEWPEFESRNKGALPAPLPQEDLLMPPVPLAVLSERLGLNSKKTRNFLHKFGLRNYPPENRQSWTVNLAPPMPESLRRKLEGK